MSSASPEAYTAVVQSSPHEIAAAPSAEVLNLGALERWPRVRSVVVALPDLPGAPEAAEKLAGWGHRAVVGDAYDVCRRIADVYADTGQDYCVRLLATWRHTDLEIVDALVDEQRRTGCDLSATPPGFEFTLAADVASLDALDRVESLSGDSAELQRARFNPWAYIESHPERFSVRYLEETPRYAPDRVREIRAEPRWHPESEFFGRDYEGSRYHLLASRLEPGLRILDIACGTGFGSDLLAGEAAFVLGVDQDVEAARERYAEHDGLQFRAGDAQRFVEGEGERFDLVVSLHTLEHVPDDRAMLDALRRNLRPGGRLVLEVPLLSARPLGAPINPFHEREYTREGVRERIEAAGFAVEREIGMCRGYPVAPERARDAVQLWARR